MPVQTVKYAKKFPFSTFSTFQGLFRWDQGQNSSSLAWKRQDCKSLVGGYEQTVKRFGHRFRLLR